MTDEGPAKMVDASLIDLNDMMDDENALANIKESVLEDYVYRAQGKLRLSKKGVDWACREYAKHGEVIEVLDHPKVVVDPEDSEYILVTVLAQRFALTDGKKVPLDTNVGAKRQWRKMRLSVDYTGNLGKPGEIVLDEFFFEKAVSKAQRNGKLGLMEADFVARVLDAWLQKKTGNKGVPDQPRKAPPAQETKKSPVEQAREAAKAREKPAETKTNSAPAGELSKPETRQRLYGMLTVVGFGTDDEKKAAIVKFLPGTTSTKQVEDKTLVELIAALKKLKDGVWKLYLEQDEVQIVDEKGQVMFPKKKQASAPATEPEAF